MLGEENPEAAVVVLGSAYDLVSTLAVDEEEPSHQETLQATSALQHRVRGP